MNATLKFLKANGLPASREMYLAVEFLGDSPEQLDAEAEAELMAALDAELDTQWSASDRRLLDAMGICIEA